LIEISANDVQGHSTLRCHDLISSESKSGKCWGTNGTAIDHFVKIDFRNFRLCPSAYSVKTHSPSWSTGFFLQSWHFEGSNDDLEWEVLDNHTTCDDLKGNDRVVSFGLSTHSSTTFRFLRFIMIGTNSGNSRQLSLQQLEVFGHLFKENP
jgi:hypothetical protein